MALTNDQTGVLRGMLLAIAVTFFAGVWAILSSNPWIEANSFEARILLIAHSFIPVALCLLVSIAALARQRFFEPQDIDAMAASGGTQKAAMMSAIIQNTLEQSALAALVYTISALMLPAGWTDAVFWASILFLIGRIFFALGYRKGARSRAFGFAITFYPTIGLCLLIAASGLQ